MESYYTLEIIDFDSIYWVFYSRFSVNYPKYSSSSGPSLCDLLQGRWQLTQVESHDDNGEKYSEHYPCCILLTGDRW